MAFAGGWNSQVFIRSPFVTPSGMNSEGRCEDPAVFDRRAGVFV